MNRPLHEVSEPQRAHLALLAQRAGEALGSVSPPPATPWRLSTLTCKRAGTWLSANPRARSECSLSARMCSRYICIHIIMHICLAMEMPQ